jgi:altronate hydrolase
MPSTHPALVRIHRDDTVAVALAPLAAGTSALGVTLVQEVPQGHKVALVAHGVGDCVRKYGQPIGRATRAIAPGEHVHSHNLSTALAGELSYAPGRSPAADAACAATANWQGYRRADGRAATRNEVWILPTVGCVGITA